MRLDTQPPGIRIVDETYVFKADTYSRAPAVDIDFFRGDSLSLLDSAQYKIGGVRYNIFTTDVDTFFRPWFRPTSRLPDSIPPVPPRSPSAYTISRNDPPPHRSRWSMSSITVNGSVTDWLGDEKMQVDSNENLWFMLTWDDTNAYFAYQPKQPERRGRRRFFVYFDCQ